jgi:protein MAK16
MRFECLSGWDSLSSFDQVFIQINTMQHDEIIWQLINHQFCSFKATISKDKDVQTFCKNEYNVSGMCNKSSCPLANSRYATIKEEKGRCFLYIKTIERAHSPKNLWEKIKLPRNYAKALGIVHENLQYWPKYLLHKNKQRLTKIHQYLIRMRRLRKKIKPRLTTINKKIERRERGRERKAERAAQLNKAIEGELLERLKQGTYGDIYNFSQVDFNAALDKSKALTDEEIQEREMEKEREEEEEGEEGEGEESDDGIPTRQFIEDFSDSDSDIEDFGDDQYGFNSSSSSNEDSEDSEDFSSSDDDDDDDDDKRSFSSGSSGGGSSSSSSSSKRVREDDGSDEEDKPKARPKRKRPKKRKKKKGPSKPHVLIEYEQEMEMEENPRQTASW